MKVNRHDKAAALTDEQLKALLAAAPSAKHRCLWTVQQWTAARIGEALLLTWGDVGSKQVTFRRSTTKTKTTRQLLQAPALAEELAAYKEHWAKEHGHQPKPSEALFPAAGSTTSTMTRQAADKAFRAACKAVAIEGASLHSFRRTMAQNLVAKGVPLPVVQKATGHKSLSSLGEYLTASQEDVLAAMLA
ncbi:site-specific integrase [Cyanobium sp. Maggiore-St4-Cus]|uniref:tyrosine-type recombinase/integrase n=1 Tax=Cyanobium sp. Maggiore-St4-Cus TaxID=2823717 RepID=UPI0020CD6125|nr:site-specific integrase [Cyanobium sp. Maggiore-St4-Cus]MCP9790207.1 site-specific integrase [Cyanobium sp. Maggiore-St4-Cus]